MLSFSTLGLIAKKYPEISLLLERLKTGLKFDKPEIESD